MPTRDSIHAKCRAVRRDGDGKPTGDFCGRSKGHHKLADPQRRLHLDPSSEVTWAEPPTPRGIGALLRKAGHQASQSRRGSVRGLPERSAGYRTSTHTALVSVEVEYLPSSLYARQTKPEEIQAMLERYREVIESHGYVTAPGATGPRYSLIVHAATPEH